MSKRVLFISHELLHLIEDYFWDDNLDPQSDPRIFQIQSLILDEFPDDFEDSFDK